MPQGYRPEEGADESAQDSLSRDGRQGGNQGGNGQQGREPRTIASGRAPQKPENTQNAPVSRPPMARRGKPVTLGAKKPPQRPVRTESSPQAMQQQRPQVSELNSAPANIPPRTPQPPVQYNPVQNHNYAPQPQAQAQPQQIDAETKEQVEKMARNNRINIAQVIKDFRGTYNAIGTPKVLVDEVEDYLKEVIEHTKGEAPSINFVQTNLQNAAVIIDTYISKTLDKESKVVQNWLDALFLQRINYRYNDGEINQDFLVKFPEGDNAPQQPDSVMDDKPEPVAEKVEDPVEEPMAQHEPIQETQQHYGVIPDYEPQKIQEYQAPANQTVPIQPASAPKENPVQMRETPPVAPRQQQPKPKQLNPHAQRPQPVRKAPPKMAKPQPMQAQIKFKKPQITVIPEDNELKALFVQAKKQAFANNPAKAMNIFQKALLRAEAINDSETQSKICFEMGKIYDDNNYLVQALSNYNKSLKDTTDTSIKTKAHFSMAKIYDDVNQVNSAIDHYLTSVSYAGQENNLSSQSQSLTNIGNIYTDKYNQEAFIFYDEANVLVAQTDDASMKGYVSGNTAGAYNKFNKPDKALKYYANAVKNYSVANEENSVAENYYAAGELMYDLKNIGKARILLKKALAHTNPYRDAALINKINDLIEEMSVTAK